MKINIVTKYLLIYFYKPKIKQDNKDSHDNLSYHLSYHLDVMHEITSRLLADKIVATNNIKAPNPPLTTSIFGYVSQIGESYFPLIGKKIYLLFQKRFRLLLKYLLIG